MANKLWLLEVDAPDATSDRIQALLAQDMPSGWAEKDLSEGRQWFGIHSEDPDFLENLAKRIKDSDKNIKTKLTEVENKDWQSAWREYFTPVEAGSRFVILPPWLAHIEHTKRQEIIIEPKNAFGTGHHASTVLCLAALSDLLDKKRLGRNDWFLDLGCGSGILAIAAAKAGLDGTALDIDPAAIANARENRELNEAERVEILKGGIEKIGREKFDLIMANILADTLIDLAPKICGALKKKACLILGGILASQAQAVIEAYQKFGLGEPRQYAEDEWRALLWD